MMGYRHDILRKIMAVCVLALCMAAPTVLRAQQFEDRMFRTDYTIDSTRTGELRLAVENLSFFHDNEFSGSVVAGYTLPGLWLLPRLTYQPLGNIRLELGLRALGYAGANKYPNYSYSDIATWGNDGYQRGMHVRPSFRAQLRLRRLNIVLGDIYGGSNHGLLKPLYTSELNMTADPEAGAQLLFDAPRFHLDVWVNWEKFIFRQDTHGEAFTFGVSTRVLYNDSSARVHFYSPVQAVVQHNGGEIDTTSTPVSTLVNAAAGVGVAWRVRRPLLKRLFVEADLLGYYEENGNSAPVDKGHGAYVQAGAVIKGGFQVNGGYFYGKDFISLLGLPFFGTVSTKSDGGVYGHMHTPFISASFSRNFGKSFAFGAQASLFYSVPGTLTLADGTTTASKAEASYSFGMYFRANMDFLLKKFK